MENPIKMDDLGVPPFKETPMYSFIPSFSTDYGPPRFVPFFPPFWIRRFRGLIRFDLVLSIVDVASDFLCVFVFLFAAWTLETKNGVNDGGWSDVFF